MATFILRIKGEDVNGAALASDSKPARVNAVPWSAPQVLTLTQSEESPEGHVDGASHGYATAQCVEMLGGQMSLNFGRANGLAVEIDCAARGCAIRAVS